MMIALVLRRESSGVEIRCFVSGRRGQCRDSTSIWGRSSASVAARVCGIAEDGALGHDAVHLVFAEVGE